MADDGDLLAVGGPLHGQVARRATDAARVMVVTQGDRGAPLMVHDLEDDQAVRLYEHVWVYTKTRVDGLLVWHCGSAARTKETAVDALAIAAGLKPPP